MSTRSIAMLVLLAVAAGCARTPRDEQPFAPPTEIPAPAGPTVPEVVLPSGSVVQLELATTPEEISRGLMFRPALLEGSGMLFLFGEERVPSFWMKNTLVALDLVFLDSGGAVVDLIANVQPCRADPCPQYVPRRPAAAVLEIGAGTAAANSVAVGARLQFRRVPDYPTR